MMDELKKDLFSRSRTRKCPILSIDYDSFMSLYPEFTKCIEFTLRSPLNDTAKYYKPFYVTQDDYKIIGRYIGLCEGRNTYKEKSFSFWVNKIFRMNIGGSSKELKPEEYDRILELSKHVIIESGGKASSVLSGRGCSCGSDKCSIPKGLGITKDPARQLIHKEDDG